MLTLTSEDLRLIFILGVVGLICMLINFFIFIPIEMYLDKKRRRQELDRLYLLIMERHEDKDLMDRIKKIMNK